MTVYSEPTAIDPNSCNPPEQEEDLQYIHSRLVKSQLGLFRLLVSKYGENKFEIEMRHNVYRIKGPSGSTAINLDEPSVRTILRSTTEK